MEGKERWAEKKGEWEDVLKKLKVDKDSDVHAHANGPMRKD